MSLYVYLDHSSSKGQSKYGRTLYNVHHSSSKGQSKYRGTLYNVHHSSSKGQSKYGGTLYNVDHSSSKGQSKYGGTFDFCRFCVVIRFFSSPLQRPMTRALFHNHLIRLEFDPKYFVHNYTYFRQTFIRNAEYIVYL